MKTRTDAIASASWCALAAAGIAFWFVVGFPFGHHNESYDWVAWISTPDAASVCWHRFYGAGGYRPLAMSIAWGLFRASGGSLVPIQLFNFLLTVLAWWTLARSAAQPRTFALAALVSGGVLFAGYIFLFHLHGVFYGPLLLWLALAVRAAERDLTGRSVAIVFAAALVAALAHTFALVLGLAFFAGAAIERGWLRRPGAVAFAALAMVLGAALIVMVAPRALLSASGPGLLALVASFRAVEVNRVVSVVVAAFAVATVLTTRWPGRGVTWTAIAAVIAGAGLLLMNGLPLVFLWLVAGWIKAARHGRWTLALLLAASLGLAYAGGSGSPTYGLFAIALLTYLVAVDAEAPERLLAWLRPAHAMVAASLLLVLALVVRSDRPVPLVSRLALPVLAERERTHQSERLLRELLDSPWRRHPVRLAEDAATPAASGGAIERGQRPPTNQVCLDAFLLHARGTPDSSAAPVILTFGGGPTPGRRLFVVPGRHAGEAVASIATP